MLKFLSIGSIGSLLEPIFELIGWLIGLIVSVVEFVSSFFR